MVKFPDMPSHMIRLVWSRLVGWSSWFPVDVFLEILPFRVKFPDMPSHMIRGYLEL